MKRTHFALACASALLLSSCFNKNGDGPSRPSIPPRSLLAGKVEMRTTTLLDASGKVASRVEETFGKQGERLRRDSSELNGTTPTLRFSKAYHRDKTGYLSSITTHRITTAGEEKREEAFTYKPYGEGVRLLTAQTLYDGAKNKLTETTYTYLGLRPESSITTTYPNASPGQTTSQVVYTQYRQEGVFEVARSYERVKGANPKDPDRPRYLQEEWVRRDLYGRPIQREVIYFDTSVDPEKQDLNKPTRLELQIWRYTAYGDEEVYSLSTYTPRKDTAPSKPSGKSLSTEDGVEAVSTTPQRKSYLELSDLLIYEYRYTTPDKNGFPTHCEVTETKGLKKIKSTTSRTIAYRLFPEGKGK